jgi:hypothetical protein
LHALPSTVSMYLTSLIQTSVSVAVLNSILYAVKWHHNIFLFEDPCVNRLVNLVLEGGKRICRNLLKRKNRLQLMLSLNYLNLIKVDSTCLTRDLFACSYSYMRDFLDIKKFQI